MCELYDDKYTIILNDYLDLLLSTDYDRVAGGAPERTQPRRTKFMQHEELVDPVGAHAEDDKVEFVYKGGIRLPSKRQYGSPYNDDGSGNIVIIGEPGVGKSTLAFQIAAECTSQANNGIAVYFSVDVSRTQLIKSMCGGGDPVSAHVSTPGSDHVNTPASNPESAPPSTLESAPPSTPESAPVNTDPNAQLRAEKTPSRAEMAINRMSSFPSRGVNDNIEELEKAFVDALNKEADDSIVPQILMPMLSPRGISSSEDASNQLFMDRFKEIELMLRAIVSYNAKGDRPRVKLVVVDSINMLGERPLTREQIGRIFELFEHYGIIGLFTLGENTSQTDAEAINSATVKYIADVVIQLRRELFNNYTCMTFEVVKSRYVKPTVGKHPYKIIPPQQGRLRGNDIPIAMAKRVEVLPTLHYIIPGSEHTRDFSRCDEQSCNLFGIKALNKVLPDRFGERKKRASQVITLTGESGQYKSDIAINALINGLMCDPPQNGLIVRLSDRDTFAMSGVRLEEGTCARLKTRGNWVLNTKTKIASVRLDVIDDTRLPDNFVKRSISAWELPRRNTEEGQARARLVEVVFRSGALLPEEFINDLLTIVRRHDIKRLVFTDIKYIGTSYPFLVDSGTSGNLFISAFIHIMRNYGVDVILTSSESGFDASDEEMKKAKILSDAVVCCERRKDHPFDTIISGEGQKITRKKLIVKQSHYVDVGYKRCRFEFHKPGLEGQKMGVTKSAALVPFVIQMVPASQKRLECRAKYDVERPGE